MKAREAELPRPPDDMTRTAVDSMPPIRVAGAVVAVLGLALFKKKQPEPAKPQPPARPPAAAAAPAAPKAPPAPLVLKAFVLNRKAELVGELAAEEEAVDISYDDVLKLLEGKGLTKVQTMDSPPYRIHILQEREHFIVAFTKSRDDAAVRTQAKTLLADTLRDLG